jgi:hypothetical protein
MGTLNRSARTGAHDVEAPQQYATDAGQRAAIEEALIQLRRIRDVWNGMEAVLAQAAGATELH